MVILQSFLDYFQQWAKHELFLDPNQQLSLVVTFDFGDYFMDLSLYFRKPITERKIIESLQNFL